MLRNKTHMGDREQRGDLRILRRCSRVSPGASGSCSHSSCLVRGFLAAALRLLLRPSSPSMPAGEMTACRLPWRQEPWRLLLAQGWP